jgi:hypothetical protein
LESWRCVSAIDTHGRRIWIVDAHRDDGKRFIARANEKLPVFLELESAIRACGKSSGRLFAHGSQVCAEVAASSAFSLLAFLVDTASELLPKRFGVRVWAR